MQQKGLALLVARRVEFAARVVAASPLPPAQLLAEGALIQELHDLFAHAVVEMPPLASRREDVPALAMRMLEDACARLLVPPHRFTAAALDLLAAHDWPGNLAELEALAGRLALSVSQDEEASEVGVEAVREILGGGDGASGPGGIDLMLHLPLKEARDAFERAYLEALLHECGWAMSKTADRAGLDRTNLYRKVKQLGIEAPGKEKG
jgi:two-component system, NtrC family, nitrogen regulation response regulator NtrX